MYYFVLSIALSLKNLSAPFKCLGQFFFWPKASEIVLKEEDKKDQVPETVEEMRKLVETIKEDDCCKN